jgi:hypothetical protein
MCDYIHAELSALDINAMESRPTRLAPEEMPCLGDPAYPCASLEACPHGKKQGSARIARLCAVHVQFCKHCHRPFCPGCHGIHEKRCDRQARVASVGDVVENVLGRMGL